MIISRLILKNWKNFKDVDIELKERVFLIGANASGKSNLLDVFRFLRDIAKPGGGLQKAVTDRGGISKIRSLAARRHPDVEIEVHISDFGSEEIIWKYAIGIKQEARGYRLPYLSYEKVWDGNKLIINRPEDDDKKDKVRLTQTYLEQINTNKDFREISRFFENALYLHLVPQLLKYPSAFTGQDLPGDPFGKGFLERVAKTNEKTRKAWLNKIEHALKIAVPQLTNLEYTTERGYPHLEVTYSHWRPGAGRQREEQFSDGTLRLIGLLWLLQEGDSLLLLEEPELSLNGAIVSKLAPLIYKLQKQRKRQVLISTHSSDLLNDRGISLKEIAVLEPASEGTKITIASNIKDVKKMLDTGMSPASAILPRVKPKDINQLSLEI
ncbi:MAG TPA: AAA family ATPase [Bacteroidales bacterium]|nr:AAA family ATPase [Bacteroidales bacterium]HPS17345.1 AAA family ATPase [Bacteroidales bacterium]